MKGSLTLRAGGRWQRDQAWRDMLFAIPALTTVLWLTAAKGGRRSVPNLYLTSFYFTMPFLFHQGRQTAALASNGDRRDRGSC